MKKCSFCAEDIHDEAIKCRYCHEMLKAEVPVDIEEKLLAQRQPSWRSYARYMILGVLLLPLFGLGLLVFVCIALHRAGKLYVCTSTRVIARTGMFTKNINEINISDIRSMSLKQSFIDRIVDCGDIYLATAGTSTMEIKIKNIHSPQEFKDLIAGQKSYLILK